MNVNVAVGRIALRVKFRLNLALGKLNMHQVPLLVKLSSWVLGMRVGRSRGKLLELLDHALQPSHRLLVAVWLLMEESGGFSSHLMLAVYGNIKCKFIPSHMLFELDIFSKTVQY